MIKRTIQLKSMDDVKDFSQAASKCDFDIDVSQRHASIDAKSIVGLLTLDLKTGLDIICFTDEIGPEFEAVIDRYSL